MTTNNFGAASGDWAHFSLILGLTADLLPVVSNLNAKIAPKSTLRELGKTPSQYRGDLVWGIGGWTSKVATDAEARAWSKNPDYGICLQTREVRALDIDVTDPVQAAKIRDFILSQHDLPERFRANASKHLFAFRLDGDFAKRKFDTAGVGNIVEFLATGQQFIAAGTHPSGARYEWRGGLPDEIPSISAEQFEKLWAELVKRFAVEGTATTSKSKVGRAFSISLAMERDPTAQFLIAHDLVKATDKEGKMHIVCPFEDEHTSAVGISDTSYLPMNTGGHPDGHFKCLHGHCGGRSDASFRYKMGMADATADDFDVVEDDSAPKKETWADKIESAKDAKALQLILKGGVAADKALDVVDLAEVEVLSAMKFAELGLPIRTVDIRKLIKPAKKQRTIPDSTPSWLAPWVYVENTCSFAHSEVPDYSIKREAFNAKFDRMPECVGAETQAAHLALVQHKIETVVDTLFFPKADKFFNHEGKWMMNSFTLKGVTPCDVLDAAGVKAVAMFKAHLAFTLADKSEQELFVNWMAYIYQNPGKRVGWAMLLQGAQGTGKSYFGNVLEELMGSNVKSLDTGAISGRFTGWATGALVVVVEEIRIAGTNKYQILDKLKPIISNNTIQIEEKGRDHRTVPNFTSYLLLTNHKDAVPLQDGDRRYCALFSRVQSEEQLFAELGGREAARSYFDSLFDSLRARPDALARFFADHAVPDTFDPCGRAPETTARLEMKALSVSPDRDVVENAIEHYRCDVIGDETVDLTWLNKLVQSEGGSLPKTWSLATTLSDMGFSPIEGRRVKVSGNGYHYVWTKKKGDSDEIKLLVKKYHLGRDNL